MLGRLAGALALVELLEQLGLGEVERVGPRQQRHQPALMGAVVEQRDLVLAGGPNCVRRRPWRTAIVSAVLAALIDAPEMHTRPWIRAPSIVKKRLFGFSIGLS